MLEASGIGRVHGRRPGWAGRGGLRRDHAGPAAARGVAARPGRCGRSRWKARRDWIPVHEVLEAQSFDVVLVDTRTLGRVPGRTKSDRRDCEVDRAAAQLRAAARRRPGLARRSVCCAPWCATWGRRWWPNAPTGCGGCRRAWIQDERPHPSRRLGSRRVTGSAMLRAIVAGERDPHQLATLRVATLSQE